MLHRSFKPAKCKTALKLATSRIKLMKNKKENHIKQLKRELSQLLESGQDKTASIRVEHVVREEKMIAAYDLIDIYCELIVARLPIIDSQKTCPIDLKEAVASVVFASPRCADIPELQDVRKHFTAKYGKEFINSALEVRPGCGVSRMLVEKLSANAPDGQTKLKILSAIAEEHNIEWDPKSFGEKESKPYDDLLKGPNAFHSEPPTVQASPTPPNVNSHQGHNQWHDVPVNNQQNLHSPSPQSFASSDFNTTQASHQPTRPSGPEYDRTEVKHSHLQEENTYPLGRQNWNMEFKDATAAAQAAAESAERASMAARAAAELSTRERITRQNSHESQYSNNGMRNERPRKSNELPSEDFVKNTNYNRNPAKGTEEVDICDDDERHYKDTITRHHSNESLRSDTDGIRDKMPSKNSGSPSEKFMKHTNINSSGDKSGKPNTRSEKVDIYVHKSNYDDDESHYKNDHSSAKRSGQSASLKSEMASLSVKEKKQVKSSYEVDRYSRKSSSDEEVVQLENNPSLSGMGVNKQSSGEDRNSYYPSSSSDDGDDIVNTRSHRNFVFGDSKDSFDHEKSRIEALESGNVVFDSYVSDDEIIKFDKQPQYDEQESSFDPPSITRKPSNHFEVNVDKGSSYENTTGSFKKPLLASRVSAELLSPPQFDENSPKSPSSARREDFAPATFDDSRGPSSDSEDEIEKNTFQGKLDPAIQSYKENDLFRKQDLLYSSDDREYNEVFSQNRHKEEFISQSRPKFDDDEVSSPHSLSPRRNSKFSNSPQSSRLSSVIELKGTTELYTSASTDNTKNEVFDQLGLESGNELKFTTLTGGLRNKGYKTPPYTKSPSGDSLSSKGANEDSLTYSQNVPVSPMMDSSSFSSKVGPKVEDNLSSRARFKNDNMGTNDIEEKLPQENLKTKREYAKENSSSRTRVKSYDLDIDDFEEELPEPNLANRQDMKINSSSRTRVKKYDLRTDNIEEKLPQQNLQTKREDTLENSILRSRVKNYNLDVDEFEGELSKSKLPNKQEGKNDFTKSKFSAPSGYFDSGENDSDEDLPKQPSSFKVRPESGFSRRTKINHDSEKSSHTKTKRESPASVISSSVSEKRSNSSEKYPITRATSEGKQKLSKMEHPFPKRGSPSSVSSGSVSEIRSNSSEKHSTTRPESEEKEKPSKMEQPSNPLKTATSSSGEAPSREGSLKKASHVHPKLPDDYDSFAAHFHSLRQSRD